MQFKTLNPQNYSLEQYFRFCKEAIKKNASNLKFVRTNFLDNETYFLLCQLAICKNYTSFLHIKPQFLTAADYCSICKMVLKKSPSIIQFIQTQYLPKPLQKLNKNKLKQTILKN